MMEGTPVMMTNGSDCMGGSWIWAFLIFALLGGGFGNGRNAQYATVTDMQNGFNTQDINGQLRGITYGLSDLGYALDNKIEGAKDYISGAIGNTKDYLSAGITNTKDAVITEGRGLQMQIADAYCANQKNIDALRFEMSNYSAGINANTNAMGQKILDEIHKNKIEALQGRINQLELQSAMCGVVRYPNAWTYNAGTSPFCNCNGCGCNG